LNYIPVIQNDYFVRIAYRRKPVRDYDARAATAADVLVYNLLGDCIERACSFIHDYDSWVCGERAGNLKPLLLTAAKISSALAYL
jgi:hypothetical protein